MKKWMSVLIVVLFLITFAACDGQGESEQSSMESQGDSDDVKYPWQDDANTPDLDVSWTVPEYSGGSEWDTGENGDTWELPEWSSPGLPFTDEDLNIPDMPGS